MHGLVNKAIEAFIRDTYGQDIWGAIVERACLDFSEFEAMLFYDAALTDRVLEAAEVLTQRPRAHLLEDLGTFLVTSPTVPALRRLLRFGGVRYTDFLYSLEEFAGRVRLAVDDLILPALTVAEVGAGHFRLTCGAELPGYDHAMVGVLRAMADDYGALAMLDRVERPGGEDHVILVSIVEDAFSDGKAFALGGAAG